MLSVKEMPAVESNLNNINVCLCCSFSALSCIGLYITVVCICGDAVQIALYKKGGVFRVQDKIVFICLFCSVFV